MYALVTNDDGITSPGLWELVRTVCRTGFDVTVAAPQCNATGTGTSVAAAARKTPVTVRPYEAPDDLDVEAWAVDAEPAFIVHAAGEGWLTQEPDIVFSGVNAGANAGTAIVHSGTVGAALAASLRGWRALAVSLDCGWPTPEVLQWRSASSFVPAVAAHLATLEPGAAFSLNVPNLPLKQLGPLRGATLASFGASSAQLQVEVGFGPGARGTSLSASMRAPREIAETGTDADLLSRGIPTLTELSSASGRAPLAPA